ncbi:MAG TPA: sigma 54-interacting transcriptional regulator [Syntrophales bacterium]|jgi:PAS domain S-box-containing protein|nr:sigma 54-interacting transcriptional regulator [Syntrophales bacterium]HOX93778.1 sigma 54-interacting transcriptional regulator [Syntrophales bacterium]HPI57727.1 sigma 54-interacting transcriptional regulator [Syntrophales bacterium]HPN23960.1 sigma 54-interacting transcriptional regulator [Syntrophales bacterium]HQM28239.1 sigma 54-interacting transcriptional regulator [Syntrophales bacterium]
MDTPKDNLNILNSLAVGIFTVDLDLNITFFNREAEKITGFSRREAIGCKCYEIFRTELCQEGCFLRRAIDTGTNVVRARNRILTKKNMEIPVEVNCAVIRDDQGRALGGVESFLDDSVRVTLEKTLQDSYTFEDIVSKDEKVRRILDILASVARTDSHMLILGETGAGKDLFARAVHNSSLRKGGPFVKINCAAIPATLLESELFGYKKGAFTDARSDKAGRFQLAEGGSIYLDEIGELSRELQAKLLQVLDEKEFFPLGSTRPVKVNVRVISSTNRKLRRMVDEGHFREDLFYRLNVVSMEIPPLRERPGDIPLLIDHFLLVESQLLRKGIRGVSGEAMRILMNYPYPGNVRELKHILEHACIVCRGNEIGTDALPLYLFSETTPKKAGPAAVTTPDSSNPLGHLEKEALLSALVVNGWSRKKASKALKINRTTLWRKMRRHGLLPERPV